MDKFKEFTNSDEIRINVFRRSLTGNQKGIVWLIHMFSYAMNKRSAILPNFSCFELCGVGYKKVSKELSTLVKLKVIEWDFDSSTFTILDPSAWELPVNEGWNDDLFSELIDINIESKG